MKLDDGIRGLAAVLALLVAQTVCAASISCVADGISGEYCGVGYGISVSVSTPASGATVEYAESAEGPWTTEPVTYRDVCTARPVFYRVTATGYETVTGSATVTVTPKPLTEDYVWGVYPAGDYVYDGTAKTPGAACGDGSPSIITADDFDVSYADNVAAGTAKIVFTGRNNYAGTVEEAFEILKASVAGGDEPGAGEVPEGGLSKWDVEAEYDGVAHTIDTNALVQAFASVGAGYAPPVVFTVQYAVGAEDVEPVEGWTDEAPAFVNAGTNVVWYRASAVNFENSVHAVRVVITPRDLAHVAVAPIGDREETGTPIEPEVVVTDGEPSIVTSNDFTVAYSDNVRVGTATVTLTGRNNYAGTKTTTFAIVAPPVTEAQLAAEIRWTYLRASGTYFAQIRVVCTNGLDAGISNLRYLFADRGEDVRLWDTRARSARATTATYGGETYRSVPLDANLVTEQDREVVYGVRAPGGASVPVAERTIEMYVSKRVMPEEGQEGVAGVGDFVGYLAWTSGGAEHAIPLVAKSSQAYAALAAAPALSAPLPAARLNAALAVGAVVTENSSPYVRLAAFSVGETMISGRVEVGAGANRGALGANAGVVLLGAASLTEPFAEVGAVRVGADGAFAVAKPEGCSFFKIKLTVEEVVK